jgi:magnesium transporter
VPLTTAAPADTVRLVRILEKADLGELERLLARDEFFWLDLTDPSEQDVDEIAGLLRWDPLAVEDAKEFRQRPKLDDYDDHALLVFYGVHEPGEQLVEVHLFISGRWVVTIRRGACDRLADLHRRLKANGARTEDDLIYRVLDALTDSFLPALHAIDQQLDALEDAVVRTPRPEQVEAILAARRRVSPLARVAVAQRDLFASVTTIVERMPGLEHGDITNQLRDVSDHLTRIAVQLESFRDRLATTLDLYTSMNANRLNEVTERLTLVATIFLPLSFIVGFFGQNFGWLTSRIDSLSTFLIWGAGSLAVGVAIMAGLFVRAGLVGRR